MEQMCPNIMHNAKEEPGSHSVNTRSRRFFSRVGLEVKTRRGRLPVTKKKIEGAAC